MSEPRWTPGPWRKLPGKNPNHYVIVAGDYADEGEPDLHVEVVTANPADANIIAAAPDMYEDLVELADYVVGLLTNVFGWDAKAAKVHVDGFTKSLRKARGDDR